MTAEVKSILTRLWTDALGTPPEPEGFIAQGGTSLQLVTFLTGVEDHFDVEVDLLDFVEQPTIDHLVANLAGTAGPDPVRSTFDQKEDT